MNEVKRIMRSWIYEKFSIEREEFERRQYFIGKYK